MQPEEEKKVSSQEKVGNDQPAVNEAQVAEELQQRLQRAIADMHNYRRRVQADIAQARESAKAELLRDLLTVMDNFDLALQAAEESKESGSLLEGVKMVYNQMMDFLKRSGVEQMEALGKPFDPHVHEAVSRMETEDKPAHTVVAEVRKGYTLEGRTLRPARVVVAIPPQEEQEEIIEENMED
jgi:molecular chaperone GrpE